MPTIQKLTPVQRSAPPPVKSSEPRSLERKDDFQQHLDNAAANKPSKPAATPVKPGKAEAKKPGAKSTATTKAKGKPDAKPEEDGAVDLAASASDPANPEM